MTRVEVTMAAFFFWPSGGPRQTKRPFLGFSSKKVGIDRYDNHQPILGLWDIEG